MSLLDDYYGLCDDVQAAFAAGRCGEAAWLGEQACRLARQHDELEWAFNAGWFAAQNWYAAGHPLRALALLMEILADVPPETAPSDVFAARTRALEVRRCWLPARDTLQSSLVELDQMVAADPSLPASDVHKMRSDVLDASGQWPASRQQQELAWARFGNYGFYKYLFAEDGVRINLRLNDREAAGRWCQLLGETETHVPCSRVAWYGAQTMLALWDGRSVRAETATATMEDEAAGLQNPFWEQRATAMRVRSLLLEPAHGDPAAAHHPARQRLFRRLKGKPEVYMKHERRLLSADYRLACVRYAAGMAPVDDLWYQHPQRLPDGPPPDSADFRQRVRLAIRAHDRAMTYSKYLDGCFDCDWREREIQDRQSRLEAIVATVDTISRESQ